MGQAADDIVEGWVCSYCGIYFVQPHGYPVLCEDCSAADNGESDLPMATEAELG